MMEEGDHKIRKMKNFYQKLPDRERKLANYNHKELQQYYIVVV
jgi:hypothetical protein